MMVVANRKENGSFVDDCDRWLEDASNGVQFNVAVVTRDSLRVLYGELLRSAVAFTLW